MLNYLKKRLECLLWKETKLELCQTPQQQSPGALVQQSLLRFLGCSFCSKLIPLHLSEIKDECSCISVVLTAGLPGYRYGLDAVMRLKSVCILFVFLFVDWAANKYKWVCVYTYICIYKLFMYVYECVICRPNKDTRQTQAFLWNRATLIFVDSTLTTRT